MNTLTKINIQKTYSKMTVSVYPFGIRLLISLVAGLIYQIKFFLVYIKMQQGLYPIILEKSSKFISSFTD